MSDPTSWEPWEQMENELNPDRSPDGENRVQVMGKQEKCT